MSEIHEDYIREIRSIGETLIKNAESIVGNEKNLLDIHISVNLAPGTVPKINVQKGLYPDNMEVEVE